MPMSARRLGFRFNRTEGCLTEVHEDKDDNNEESGPSSLASDQSDTQQHDDTGSNNNTTATTITSDQQQPQDAYVSNLGSESLPSQTRNFKNISIRDFFANRLNRTRSFEGGNQSPTIKEEASNWFEEFKAKVSKKSPNVIRNNAKSSQIIVDEQFVVLGDTPDVVNKNTKRGCDNGGTLTRDNCGTFRDESIDAGEICVGDYDDNADDDDANEEDSNCEGSISLTANQCMDRPKLRRGKSQRVSYIGCNSPDFDTASINTIFNRRDSRYRRQARSRSKINSSTWSFKETLAGFIRLLFPFNHDLVWKMIAMISVMVALAAMIKSSQLVPLCSFFNGLIVGIISTIICSIVVISSALVRVFPAKNRDRNKNNPMDSFSPMSSSSPEEPHQETTSGANICSTDADSAEEYTGWMIEFIGDYEQRKNYDDIKLQLIYVCLDGTLLRLCKPKRNADSNSTSFPASVQQRCYDLSLMTKQSVTLLLPKSVRNQEKWIWSKRYPIKIEFFEHGVGDQNANPEPVKLTLFVRSCREKEEWFQRFKRSIERSIKLSIPSLPVDTIPPSPTRSSINSNVSQYEEALSDTDFSDNLRYPTPLTQSKSEIMCPNLASASNNISPVHVVKTLFNSAGKSDQPQSLTVESITTDEPGPLVRAQSCDLSQLQKSEDTNNGAAKTQCAKSHSRVASPVDESSIDEDDENALGINDNERNKKKVGGQNRSTKENKSKPFRPTLDYKSFIERVIESDSFASQNCAWFNSLIGRIFFDVLSHQYWSVKFKRKIQRKLHRIRLPYFMETLTLTKIHLGSKAPQFRNVVSHHFDSFGLSIDFDMAYSGGLEMTFETKLNLLKIREQAPSSGNTSTNLKSDTDSQKPASTVNSGPTISSTTNQSNISGQITEASSPPTQDSSVRSSVDLSDTDDTESMLSSDSSSDDELDSDEISDWEDYGAERTRQTIVKFVDKIASSRYFQHATENKYIKKKLQDISNCPLVLVVQIQSLNGILTLNVPPPPTDRLWYGFRPNPELALRALPRMGDREVNLSHVTDWIERKLVDEFRKILVIPNMEDIVLRVLQSDADQSVSVVH
ncbi:Testis-expressed protein 2 [Fragariocoptes setiger]|uniref:Testis-expressed protein 2 n=1 Tax=Fragariocoptes setiger TaxID=1670756 RepID=A0ABQ7SCD6_9ACAR|nr:Testis-expressed protein 2 [Fragariocoptes setiger]